jgi:uncharacterized membrane protein
MFITYSGIKNWIGFIFLFLIPSLLTLATILFPFIKRYKLKLQLNETATPLKVVLISLSVLLILYQLFMVSLWVSSFSERSFPDLHFWGYFCWLV